MKQDYSVPRRSEIVEFDGDLDDEDLISRAPSEGARSQKPRTMKVGFSYDF